MKLRAAGFNLSNDLILLVFLLCPLDVALGSSPDFDASFAGHGTFSTPESVFEVSPAKAWPRSLSTITRLLGFSPKTISRSRRLNLANLYLYTDCVCLSESLNAYASTGQGMVNKESLLLGFSAKSVVDASVILPKGDPVWLSKWPSVEV